MEIYRQGDVLLVPCQETKPKTKPVAKKNVVLALGEVTGHHHTLTGEVALFELKDGRRMAWVEAPAKLTHQEHATINVAPGMYWVIRQREYSPEAIRQVAD